MTGKMQFQLSSFHECLTAYAALITTLMFGHMTNQELRTQENLLTYCTLEPCFLFTVQLHVAITCSFMLELPGAHSTAMRALDNLYLQIRK